MKVARVFLMLLFLAASLLCLSVRHEVESDFVLSDTPHMVVPFVENKGQIEQNILYYTQTAMNHVHVGIDRDMALVYRSEAGSVREMYPGQVSGEVIPEDSVRTRLNYFMSGQSFESIPAYATLKLMSVSQGIDLSVTVRDNGLEKIYALHPGASVDDLVIALEGGSPSIDHRGNLVVEGDAPFVFSRPHAYQMTEEGHVVVDVSYALLDDSTYGFSVGAYDPTGTLFIDPLVSSTYLGTSSKDSVSGIEVDPLGNVIVSGTTTALDFPAEGGYREDNAGKLDMFVAKFTPDLTTLLEATYIGGSGHDTLDDMTLDPSGNIILVGRTWSSDLLAGTVGYDTTYNTNRDGFVIKLANSLDAIVAGTYVGGSHEDLMRGVVADAESIRVTGSTYSVDMPMLEGSHAMTGLSTSKKSGFYVAFDSDLVDIIGSTYITGSASADLECDDIVIDSSGNTLISGRNVGGNASGSFVVTEGAIDLIGTSHGFANFVRSYNLEGSVLNASGRFIHYMWATSYGVNNSMPYPTMMAINANDDLYVSSQLHNAGSSTTDAAYMLKIDSTLSASSAVYSPYSRQSAFNFTDIEINPHDQLPYAAGMIHMNAYQFLHPGFYLEGRGDYAGCFVTRIEPDLVVSDPYYAQPRYTQYYVPGTLSVRSALYLDAFAQLDNQWNRLDYESPSVAFDLQGDIYAAFQTSSAAYSVPATRAYQSVNLGNNDLYIVHLTPELNGSLDPRENYAHDYASSLSLDTSGTIRGGDTVTVMHALENLGPDHGNDVTVTITIMDPEAVSLIGVTDSGVDTHVVDGNTITLDLKEVGLGTRETMLTLVINETFTGTLDISSVATVTKGTDAVPENNTGALGFEVIEPVRTSDLFIEGTAYEHNDALGTYTTRLRFGNNGPDMTDDVMVSVTLDPHTTLVSAFPDTFTTSTDDDGYTVVSWGPVALESGGESAEEGDPLNHHRVTVVLNDPSERGILLKTVLSVTSSNPDEDITSSGSENDKTIWFGNLPGLDLEIHGPDGSDSTSIYTGETIGYEVVMENNGDVDAHDVSLNLSTIPSYFEVWSFEAFDDAQNDLTDQVVLDIENEVLTLFVATLGVDARVTLHVEGAMISYCEPDSFVYPITADAKGKSQPGFVSEDLQAITSFDLIIQRPDLVVSITYADPEMTGVVMNSSSEKTLVALDITVENIGRGDSRPFVVNVTFDDPQTSILAVETITPSGSVSNIHMTGAKDFEIEFANNGNMLGLYGTDAVLLQKGVGEGSVRLVIETQAGAFDFDTAWIDVEIVFEDIFDIGSDTDPSTDTDALNIEFIVFDYDIDFVGAITTTPSGSYVTQTYLINFIHKSTHWMKTPLDLLGIEIDFSYLDNTDVLDAYLETVTSSPDFSVFVDGFTLVLSCDELVVTDRIFHVFVQFEVPVGEIDTLEYAKNDFELWTDVYYMTEDSPTLHEFEHLHRWNLPVRAPVITAPLSGEVCFTRDGSNNVIDIEGYTAPFTEITFYDENDAVVGYIISDETGRFSYPISPVSVPSFYAIAKRNTISSVPTPVVRLTDSTHSFCPQTSTWIYDHDDMFLVYKFVSNHTRLYSTSGWTISGFYGFINTTLALDVCCSAPKSVYVIADNVLYDDPTIVGGLYMFQIGSAHDVLIHVDCDDGKETNSTGAVLIDPDGIVYNSAIGIGNVVPGATVTCYVYDPVNGLWSEWMAAAYDNQVNPQTVNETGYFSFFTPPGTYRLVARGPDGYQTWMSSDIEVIDTLVTVNIPYTVMPEDEASHVIHVDDAGLSDGVGADMSDLTIETGDVVEWIIGAGEVGLEPFLNPTIRIRSLIDVRHDISGFDSGLLMSGESYVRKFNHPGVYTYTFKDGDGEMTGTITVVGGDPVDTILPDTPLDLVLSWSSVGDKVTLTWTPATDNVGVSGYRIYRSTDNGPFIYVGDSTEASYTDKSVTCEYGVSYLVVAIDAAGNVSGHSEPASLMTDAMTTGPWVMIGIISAILAVSLGTLAFVVIKYPETRFTKGFKGLFRKHGTGQ